MFTVNAADVFQVIVSASLMILMAGAVWVYAGNPHPATSRWFKFCAPMIIVLGVIACQAVCARFLLAGLAQFYPSINPWLLPSAGGAIALLLWVFMIDVIPMLESSFGPFWEHAEGS